MTRTMNATQLMLLVFSVLAMMTVGAHASLRAPEHSASSDTASRAFVNTGVCVDATLTEILQSVPTMTTEDGKRQYMTQVPAVAIKDGTVFTSDSVYPVIQYVHLFVRGPPLFEGEEHTSLVQEIALRTIAPGEGWQRGVRFIGISGDFVVAAEAHWIHFLEEEHRVDSSSGEPMAPSYKLVQSMELYPAENFDCTPSSMAAVDGLVVVTYNNAEGLVFQRGDGQWTKLRRDIPPSDLAVAAPPSVVTRNPSVFIYTTPWEKNNVTTVPVIQFVCTTPSCDDVVMGRSFDVPVNGLDMSLDPISGTIAIGYPYSSAVEVYTQDRLLGHQLAQTITGEYSFGKAVSFVGTTGTLLVSTPVDLRRSSIEHAYENADLEVPDCVFEEGYACEIPPPGTIEAFSMDPVTMNYVATQTHSMIDPTYDLPFGIVISSSEDSSLFYTTAPNAPCAKGPILSSVGAVYVLN